jgi:putative endonuclease
MENISRKKLGVFAEDTAVNFLSNKGYKILERNFKRKLGELDIVATKNGDIIFVEVKSVKSSKFFLMPEDHLTPKKIYKLKKMCELYLTEKDMQNKKCRLDAILITISEDGEIKEIKHIEGIDT